MSNSEDFIWIVSSETENTEQEQYKSPQRGAIKEISESIIDKGVRVPAQLLKSNFQSFFQTMIGLVSEIPKEDLAYTVDEIIIHAEVSGSGTIKLIGGITSGAKGGITFKLKRVQSDKGVQSK